MTDLFSGGLDVATADLSDDGRYRYRLTRRWADGDTWATFVMLNPSTADATEDDPTIRRCTAFAKREGCSALQVVNLFAYRATDPRELTKIADPIGPENDAWLSKALRFPSLRIAAWGTHGRPDRVVVVKSFAGSCLRALGVTKDGHPRHPLYVRADAPLVQWPAGSEAHR